MEKIALFIIRLLKSPIKWCGADYEQVEAILKTKLAIDFRLSPSIGQASGKSSSAFMNQLIIFLIMGAGISLGFIFISHLLFILNFFFSMIMMMLALFIVAGYSSVLFDHRDNQILLVRPISDRTLLIARLLHIQIYLGFMAIALSGVSSIAIAFKHGVFAFLAFLMAVELCAWIILCLIVFLYMVLSKVIPSERFKDIILYLQMFLTMILCGGYQLSFMMIDPKALLNSIMEMHWWKYLIPPYWLTGFVGFLSGKAVNSEIIILALIALFVPVAGAIFLVRYLSGGFSDVLSEGAAQKIERKKKIITGKTRYRPCKLFCVSEIEQMGWKLAMSTTKRDRNFKMGLYPVFGIILVMALFMIRPDFTSFAATMENLSNNSSFFLLFFISYLGTMPISMLPFTDTPEAAWIYKVLPIKDHGHILTGAIKAMLFKFFGPIILILFVMTLTFWGVSKLPALVMGCLLIVLISQYSIVFIGMALPFTQAREMTQSGVFPAMMLLQFIFIAIAVGLVYLVLKLNIWVAVVICVVLFLLSSQANSKIRKKSYV